MDLADWRIQHLLTKPRRVPKLNIPRGTDVVDVGIIDTTTYQRTRTESMLGRAVHGHTSLDLPTYAFLIRHAVNDINMLFDLGARKDWQSARPPELRSFLNDKRTNAPLQVSVHKDIFEILNSETRSGGVDPEDISAVIWSSHSVDHRGDISMFPAHTKLIVGPNTRELYSGTEINALELEGREVVEMTAPDFSCEIGGFPAHDVFRDGSFYLLSCPGPTESHLCGLARVTLRPTSTFVLLGGDCAMHCGEFRPSPFMPLPQQIEFKPTAWVYSAKRPVSAPLHKSRKLLVCAGEFVRDKIHPWGVATEAFYELPALAADATGRDPIENLAQLEIFDACPEVLVCLSHDQSLMNILPFYPCSLNDWQAQGYKEKLQWDFLYDFDLERPNLSQ